MVGTAAAIVAAPFVAFGADDVDRAREALARTTLRSELASLWGKSAEWRAACADLAARLAAQPAPLPRWVPPRKFKPKVGDVVLVPLKDGSRGLVKIVSLTQAAPCPFQFGVYPVRLGPAEEAPATLPAAFVELRHGLAPLGPTFWPLVRNEAVKASEILPIASGHRRSRVARGRACRRATSLDSPAACGFAPSPTGRQKSRSIRRSRVSSSRASHSLLANLLAHILEEAERAG